jgi:ribosome maturation factor RimP
VKGGGSSPSFNILIKIYMIEREFIKKIITEKLQNTDYYLVDVIIGTDNDITVEVDNDNGVSIDDCAMLSNYIEENLDREKEDYSLEVGSSGITSPFKVLRQYQKNIGNEVEMLLKNGTKLTGILKEATENEATVTVERKEKKEGAKRKETLLLHLTFPYKDIKYTKYLIRF